MKRIREHAAVGRERRRTYAAGDVHGLKPLALVEFAEIRAGVEIVRGLDRRDFVQEVREELADGRNYFCWALERADRAAHLNMGRIAAVRQECMAGLAATVLAFEHTERAALAMAGWRSL